MTVEHKQTNVWTVLEALGGNGMLLPPVSTLDAAIIVFYMEKKLFALNSLLEEKWLYIFGVCKDSLTRLKYK